MVVDNRDDRNLPAPDSASDVSNLRGSRLLNRGIELLKSARWMSIPVDEQGVIPTEASLFVLSTDWDSAFEGNTDWELNRQVNVYEFRWDGTYVRKHTFALHQLSPAGYERISRRQGSRPRTIGTMAYIREWFWIGEEQRYTTAVNYLFDLNTDKLVTVWSSDSFVDEHRLEQFPGVPVLVDFPYAWTTQDTFASLVPVSPLTWNGNWLDVRTDGHILRRLSVATLLHQLGAHLDLGDVRPSSISARGDGYCEEIAIELSLDTTFRSNKTFSYKFQHYGQEVCTDDSVWIRESRHSRELARILLSNKSGTAQRYVLPDPNDLVASGQLSLASYGGTPFVPDGPMYPSPEKLYPDQFPAYSYHLQDASGGRLLVGLEVKLERWESLAPPTLVFEATNGKVELVRQLADFVAAWWHEVETSRSFDRLSIQGSHLSKGTPVGFLPHSPNQMWRHQVITTALIWYKDEPDFIDDSGSDDVIIVSDVVEGQTWGFVPHIPADLPRPVLFRSPE